MSRKAARGLVAAAGAVALAIGLTPSAASATALRTEICMNSGFCIQIINVELPGTPVPGETSVSGSAAGVSAEADLTLP
jgi:hypothetical protein